jgi:alkanesulfonate monooxygenase SsuD/methylene tetrahydromethanopterin reductase-like flavin-dependent oxidoreductase (luciferase family)
MTVELGYLLPTRERVMEGQPQVAPLVALAERAESLGLDSIWVGDSLLAKPRHEPLTLLAAIAGRTRKIKLGTAVLLPVLRNPVLLAHQLATLDQASTGRLIIGVGTGVPFEKRGSRMLEAVQLCQALWTGKSVNWHGRWTLHDAVIGPTPYAPGGPPIWAGGNVIGVLKRTGRHFDGWFPSGPSDATIWGQRWQQVRAFAQEAGRSAESVTGALYLTVSVDEDESKASDRLDDYLHRYYNQPAHGIRAEQACFAGTLDGAADWIQSYIDVGARHFALRFPGDHERNMDRLAALRETLDA